MKLKALLFTSFALMANVLFANETNDIVSKDIYSNATILANQITCSVSSSSICLGTSVSIAFVASGTYNSGNVFTAQLSNASGSFTSPNNIGTFTSVAGNGSITASIPTNTTSGNGYRIRVVASNQSTTGLDNGSNITINAVFPVFSPIPSVCSGDYLSPLPTTSNNGVTGTWWPSLNNTATTVYTFTPDAGQCSLMTTSLMIVVVNPISAVFTQVPPICSGDALSNLPTTSGNGITGSWTPAMNKTIIVTGMC